MKTYGMAIAILLGMTTAACTQHNFEASQLDSIAKQVAGDVTCNSTKLEENLWDGLKTYLQEHEELPSAEVLKKALLTEFDSRPSLQRAEQKVVVNSLHKNFGELIDILLTEAPEGERVTTSAELLILLSAIDVGDRSTTFRSYLQDKVRGEFSKISRSVNTLSTEDCVPSEGDSGSKDQGSGENPGDSGATDGTTDGGAEPEDGDAEKNSTGYVYHKNKVLESGKPLAVFGARWTLATAYQSCMSVQIPDMNVTTPEVSGIKITGKHSDGVGSKRMISSVTSVQNTHPYLRGLSRHENGCFSVRTNPLIYDYGGKPYGTTKATSTINVHKDSGSGTSVLGIDCSAYVYSSMATAGLRLKQGRELKASDSWAWGSGAYVEPQKNGLTCLDKITITPTSNLKAGDIVAVYGHVLMIEKVGKDPFGISRAKSSADCSKLGANGYDFTVAQSSPSKGGVGINFFEAKEYVPTSEKMTAGFKQYAYYTCLAKFNNKSYIPNLGTLTVSRHKGTAACMATRVKLENESCVERCSSFVR